MALTSGQLWELLNDIDYTRNANEQARVAELQNRIAALQQSEYYNPDAHVGWFDNLRASLGFKPKDIISQDINEQIAKYTEQADSSPSNPYSLNYTRASYDNPVSTKRTPHPEGFVYHAFDEQPSNQNTKPKGYLDADSYTSDNSNNGGYFDTDIYTPTNEADPNSFYDKIFAVNNVNTNSGGYFDTDVNTSNNPSYYAAKNLANKISNSISNFNPKSNRKDEDAAEVLRRLVLNTNR